MKIVGLISDTHIPSMASMIPKKVLEVFKDASLIVHAGDLTRLSVLRDLECLAPVLAVYGNMDGSDVREQLPRMNFIDVEGWKIGVVHSLGVFPRTREMKKMAKQNNLNVLVFGHTHRPSVKREDNILFINPGSPTAPIPPFLTKPTLGLLKVFKEKIEPEIVQI